MRILIFILLCFIHEAKAQIINASPAYRPFIIESGITPPLDIVTNAAWAYSVRKLRTAQGDSCFLVRRTSDNTQQVIGFVPDGSIYDTTALKTFIGSSHGRVVTWYDGSGSNIHATTTDTLTQPFIAHHGKIIYFGGKPSITQRDPSDTTNRSLWKHFNILTAGSATCTFFTAMYMTQPQILLSEKPVNTEFLFFANAGSGGAANGGAGTPSIWINNNAMSGTTRGDAWNTLVLNSKQNIFAATNFNSSTWSNFCTEHTTVNFIDGPTFIGEMIMYYSDKSADRTTLQDNLNSFFISY